MLEWLNKPLGKGKQEKKQSSAREVSGSVVWSKTRRQVSAGLQRLSGLRFGKGKQEKKQSSAREVSGSVVWSKTRRQVSAGLQRLLGLRFGKGQRKIEQLPEAESGGQVIPEDAQQPVSSASLRSLLKTAIADAEQIVASIKMRAQAEAEAEATRIIAQAKLEVEEIKDKAESAAQNQAEEILSAANRKAETTEIEAKQKALQYLIKASEALLGTSEAIELPLITSAPMETDLKPETASIEEVEEPVQLQEEVVSDKVEEPVQLQEEVVSDKVEEPVQLQEEVVSDKVEEPVQLQEEVVSEKVEEPIQLREETTPLEPDSRDLYTGEVELVITAPVELKLVSRLYNYLQTIPELKILYTRGSWDQGTTITVVLEKPMPLVSIITGTPDVEVTSGLLEKDGPAVGKTGGLLRGGEKGPVKRIQLVLKEAHPR